MKIKIICLWFAFVISIVLAQSCDESDFSAAQQKKDEKEPEEVEKQPQIIRDKDPRIIVLEGGTDLALPEAEDESTGSIDETGDEIEDTIIDDSGTIEMCRLDEGDFFEYNFPDNIKACHDQGKVWNFYSKTCSNLPKETSFECTWTGVNNALVTLGVNPAANANIINKNGKLVGCGEKTDKKTVVFQYFVPPTTDIDEINCSWSQSTTIWIVCGRQFSSQAELDAWVALGNVGQITSCLN